MTMKIQKLPHDFSVCKVTDYSSVDCNREFTFIGSTDEERSLVCRTHDLPTNTIDRDDGWKAFRIQGILDFSLIGILSAISAILAEHQIGIFAISTFNTDYILVKAEQFQRAADVLACAGYEIIEEAL